MLYFVVLQFVNHILLYRVKKEFFFTITTVVAFITTTEFTSTLSKILLNILLKIFNVYLFFVIICFLRLGNSQSSGQKL